MFKINLIIQKLKLNGNKLSLNNLLYKSLKLIQLICFNKRNFIFYIIKKMKKIFNKNTKLLVTLLTSSKLEYLIISYESVKNQQPLINFNYDIYIVVNTLNDNYFNEVIKYFNDKDVTIIRTKSNGRPGRGHNSVLEIFNEKKEYDYLFSLDGDDFLYPCAFRHIEQYITSKKVDILMLMYHDTLDTKKKTHIQTYFLIENKVNLIYNIPKTMNNDWLKTKSINPFENPIYKLNTYGRMILISRKTLQYNLHYDENCKLYDDFILSMQILNLAYQKKLNIFRTSDTNIYIYNTINIQSATNNFSLNDFEEEDNYFKNSIKNKFSLIKDWDLTKIPFITIKNDPLFTYNDKFNYIVKLIKKINIQNYLSVNKEHYEILIKYFSQKNIDIPYFVLKYKKLLNQINYY